ncbi:glycerophosphodiester phosphodiesterase family protein [uncultured Kordia sp.]|uniref:glycerophosphodiester phosphodiesterase family protein n=1 Tax=uncultured Kordia sp. TaxID=507699 RepID=UPI002621E32D|nr:glycerophosphodiester phosphodiesterase family protein [uncultured Kordia sp.]
MNIKNQVILKKPIAHRGLHDGNLSIPENTLLAFEKAIEKKLPIELDVQIIKDGTLIIFHDTNLIRCCKRRIRIENLTYTALKGFTIFNSKYTIPTLKEVLKLVDGSVPILIDIKNYTIQKRLEKTLLVELENYKGFIMLQSFNPFTVNWLKTHTSYATGYLVSKYNYLHFFNYFLMEMKNPIDFLSVDKRFVSSKYFKNLSKKNIPVLLWTLNEINEIYTLKDSYDNYIFENFIP